MKKRDYNRLTLQERAEKLWKEGTLISSTSFFNFHVELYSINNLFVEVYKHPNNLAILLILVCEGTSVLMKYLNDIEVSQLLDYSA